MDNAIGMVMVQADCTADEALALLEQRARALDRTLDEIAEEVIDRKIRFDHHPS